MAGDGAVSFDGDDAIFGLGEGVYHTFRYETLDGANYWFSADGIVFTGGVDNDWSGLHAVKIGAFGGCDLPTTNEWDYIRFGELTFGEKIIGFKPRAGLLDARRHAGIDRFTVFFEAPAYVFTDEITIEVDDGVPPEVLKTWRTKGAGPEELEIVLDAPIPMGMTTRFTFDDGMLAQTVEYTFAPADTDGDGDADLRDAREFQNCYGNALASPAGTSQGVRNAPTGACLALDLIKDNTIDANDLAEFTAILAGPGVPTIK